MLTLFSLSSCARTYPTPPSPTSAALPAGTDSLARICSVKDARLTNCGSGWKGTVEDGSGGVLGHSSVAPSSAASTPKYTYCGGIRGGAYPVADGYAYRLPEISLALCSRELIHFWMSRSNACHVEKSVLFMEKYTINFSW